MPYNLKNDSTFKQHTKIHPYGDRGLISTTAISITYTYLSDLKTREQPTLEMSRTLNIPQALKNILHECNKTRER
jgi:hypothetical protein